MGEEVKHRLTIIQLKSAYVGAQSLQSCLTLCDLMDFSPPGSLVYGTFPIRILEWVVLFSSRKCSPPRDGTHVSCISCIAGGFFSAEPRGSPRWRVTDNIIKKKRKISLSLSLSVLPFGYFQLIYVPIYHSVSIFLLYIIYDYINFRVLSFVYYST